MKSGLGISPAMTILLSILAQIAAQMRTWYNDNMAITFFLSNIFCWKVSYFAALGECSQKQVLLQNNSIRKSIKLIRGAKEVQGESCCIAGSAIHPVWLAGELVREFFCYKNSETGFRRLNFYAVGIIFITGAAIKIKKVIPDFFFSDLRAGGTKRAGDVTVENFEKKLTKLFTRSIPTIVLM